LSRLSHLRVGARLMLCRPDPSPAELRRRQRQARYRAQRLTTVVGKRRAGVLDRLATLTKGD